MISYLILHYNRPYLLENSVKLVRKYAPPETQIVVADDGSDSRVIERIKKLPIDNLFVQTKNKNTWTEGTCSNTIKEGRKLCNNKFFLFSEDDFFLCPTGVEEYDPVDPNIMPRYHFDQNPSYNIIKEATDLLRQNKDVKGVSLARDGRRVPVRGELLTENVKWNYINHDEKKSAYYCNWPFIMRTSDHKSVEVKSGNAIWSFEGIFSKQMDKKFGSGDWIACPEKRHYIHVGFPFSKRLNNFLHTTKRIKALTSIQNNVFNKVIASDLEAFNKWLLEEWIEGRFFIDFDEMIESGLNESFTAAFERLRD